MTQTQEITPMKRNAEPKRSYPNRHQAERAAAKFNARDGEGRWTVTTGHFTTGIDGPAISTELYRVVRATARK